MAGAKRRRGGKGGSSRRLRSGLSATALILIGGCVGVALGSLLDGPRVFLRHLLEPVESAEIVGKPAPPGADELTEYRALQQTRAQAKAPPAESAPVEPGPAPVAAPPARPEVHAHDLISKIAAKRAETAQGPAEQLQPAPRRTGTRVVQVAAYRDVRSAQALVRRLRRSGFDSYVSSTRPEGEERFRVRVSPGGDTDIEALASELRERGFAIWVTIE